MEQNGTLYVPPVPGNGFIVDETQIPWDSEILQSFAELTNITNMTLQYNNIYEDAIQNFTYQIDSKSYYYQSRNFISFHIIVNS